MDQKPTLTKSLGKIPYDVKIFTLFALVGIIIKLFFGSITEDGSTGPATATIWGYGMVALSLFGLMITAFALAYKDQFKESTMTLIKNIFSSSLPVILLIAIISWIVAQNITFFKRINQGKVANEYYQFSSISTILIVVQLVLLFKFFTDEMVSSKAIKAGKSQIYNLLASQMSYVMYMLTVLNLALVGVVQVILQYFSTDG